MGNTRSRKELIGFSADIRGATEGRAIWTAEYSGYERLPKELQSIVDYTRCPDVTNSPAIDPLFSCTEITDPDGNPGNYGYYWTSTTHNDGLQLGKFAIYIAFGEAQGEMNGQLLDVHGAGAQRGDPKSGDANDYPQYFGPQGDVRYVYNYVRCVRAADTLQTGINSIEQNSIKLYPNPCNNSCKITFNQNGKNIKFKLYTLSGIKVKSYQIENIQSGKIELNTKKLSPGVYHLVIQCDNNLYTEKIVKL